MTFPTVHSELEELSFFIARGWGGVVVEGRGRGGGGLGFTYMIWMKERGLLNSIELRMKMGSVNFKTFVFFL